MKTIPEIVNFFNDDHVYIESENRKNCTFVDLKKQIDWTRDFFIRNAIQINDTIAIVIDNGPEMATAFLSTSSFCQSAPLNPSYTLAEFDFYLEDLSPKALIVTEDSNSPVIEVAKKRKIQVGNKVLFRGHITN